MSIGFVGEKKCSLFVSPSGDSKKWIEGVKAVFLAGVFVNTFIQIIDFIRFPRHIPMAIMATVNSNATNRKLFILSRILLL